MKKFLVLLCCLPIVAYAAPYDYEDEFDGEKPWVELQTQLPAYPKPENLLAFDIGPTSKHHYSVDALSITVGQDGVVRYSLVVKSSAGAMNVSYEGIRCDTGERKLYAFGRSDNTWSKARVSKWEALERVAQHYPQRELARYFFCPERSIVKTSEEAVKALKAGIHPRAISR